MEINFKSLAIKIWLLTSKQHALEGIAFGYRQSRQAPACIAMDKNLLKSLSLPRPRPSAILDSIDTEALLI